MNAITLPKDLEAWAEAEVAAGRAENIEALIAQGLTKLRGEQKLAEFRKSLDEAEVEAKTGRVYSADEVFSELKAKLRAKL